MLNSVIRAMQDEKTVSVLIKGLMQMQEKLNEERTTLKLLEKEKKQTQTALDNLIKAIERGIISDTTNKRLQELETQIRDLDERIAVEQNKFAFTLSEDDIRRYYLSALKQAAITDKLLGKGNNALRRQNDNYIQYSAKRRLR